MRGGRAAAAALALALCAPLAACDPGGLPGGRNSAVLYVTIDARGDAHAEIEIDAGAHTRGELTRLGQEVGVLLFPDATSRNVTIDDDPSFTAASVTVSADGAYQRGRQPRFRLDTRPAVAALLRAGPTSIDVYVTAPLVPATGAWSPAASTAGDEWYWPSIRDRASAPTGVVVMRPNPWRATAGLAATVLAWLLVVVGIVAVVRRRRTWAVVVGLALVVLTVVTTIWSGFRHTEDLGVAGWLSGVALGLAHVVPGTLLLTGAVGLAVVIVALIIGREPTPTRFNPAPGWPAPPPGWLPAPGWRPDPSWPSAPEGWQFVVPVAEAVTPDAMTKD